MAIKCCICHKDIVGYGEVKLDEAHMAHIDCWMDLLPDVKTGNNKTKNRKEIIEEIRLKLIKEE